MIRRDLFLHQLLFPDQDSLSRKFEYQADRFAAVNLGSVEAMKSGLIKLNRENLSNLTPHPLYSFYHYSHPALAERLKARFPKQIAHTVVGYHVKIDEAQSRGLPIFEYAPHDRGAKVMAQLAEELELRGQPDPGDPAT